MHTCGLPCTRRPPRRTLTPATLRHQAALLPDAACWAPAPPSPRLLAAHPAPQRCTPASGARRRHVQPQRPQERRKARSAAGMEQGRNGTERSRDSVLYVLRLGSSHAIHQIDHYAHDQPAAETHVRLPVEAPCTGSQTEQKVQKSCTDVSYAAQCLVRDLRTSIQSSLACD